MNGLFEWTFDTDVKVVSVSEFDGTGEFSGIKAVTYDGAKLNGKKTKVFAYMGYPKDISGRIGAVVLVHGGGGVAYLPWVKMWNDSGYAAIAMSVTGDFPKVRNAGDDGSSFSEEKWHHGLYGDFAEQGYCDAPDNDRMRNSDAPINEQWMYHAVSQVIIANNILRSDERIDKDKIGIMGISWGGVITSITIGYDNRFAFAIPVYGSGYLTESMGNLGEFFRSGNNPDLWLAEKKFDEVNMPVLWMCKNDDIPFSLNSNSKSYIATRKRNSHTRISVPTPFRHNHSPVWERPEPVLFADSVTKGESEFPEFLRKANGWELHNPADLKITSLRICYLTEPMLYQKDDNNDNVMVNEWQYKDVVNLDFSDEDILPEGALEYYIEAEFDILGKKCIITSEFVGDDNCKHESINFCSEN